MRGIHIKQLQFGYDKSLLFNNLELALPSVRLSGTIWEKWGGKTSLLKLLAGLIFPHEGQCQVFGAIPVGVDQTFSGYLLYSRRVFCAGNHCNAV